MDHDLDMPDVGCTVRRYSKGSRSADWRADDLRIKWTIGIMVAVFALLFFYLA
jgi:hypothetical protein